MENSISNMVKGLRLKPHPEGGFFAETYRSTTIIQTSYGPRPASTAIYFLLTAGNFSAFHRIKSDEGWHHYEGDTVYIHVIHTDGSYERMVLGKNGSEGEVQQLMVPAHAWFASECIGESGFALVGCTVSPGFDFADFELANGAELASSYPNHETLIRRLTRS